MENKYYTAAVIGTGRIGFTLGFDKKREQPASHTFALLANKNVRIIAGCDSCLGNLEEWKKYVDEQQKDFNSTTGVKIFSTVEELFSNCTPDIVVISVNEDSHLKISLDVIEKKPKLVILEKPVALNVEEGNLIVAAAEKNQVPVLVNHERRFADDYIFAKEYLPSIGELMSLNARLYSGLRVYAKSAEKNGEYSLLHDGTHLVDIVMFMLEETSAEKQVLKNMEISNVYYDPEQEGVVRNVSAHFNSKICQDVNISISGRSRYFGFELDIIGREGRIKIGNGIHQFYKRKESKMYTGFWSLAEDKKIPRLIKQGKKTGYFSNMLQNGVDFLDGKAELKSTLQTGMNALEVLEAIKNTFN